MLIRRLVGWILSFGLTGLSTSAIFAQSYPNKPVRIVTSEAGGTNDLLARLISVGLSGALGQSVITDNRPTIIAIESVSKSPPDGYTLLSAAATLWLGPLLQKMPYDAVRDFAPISLVTSQPNVLVVNPSLPVKSVKELIALAKARPGELNISAQPAGSYPYLAAKLFKSMTGLNIVDLPYKGAAQALTAVVSGEAHMTFATPGSLAQYVKSNRLRGLAVSGSKPSALAPGLPTIAASGVPGFEAEASQGIFAPAGTPAPIINRLNLEIVRFIKTPDAQEKFLALGLDTVGSSPEEFAAVIKGEIDKWGKLIKDAGIKAD